MSLEISPTATEDEAAAIAAAVSAHIHDQEQAATAGDNEEETWEGDQWQFAARMQQMKRKSVRIPKTAPTDPWTAADRLE